jgi:hypothetical protein
VAAVPTSFSAAKLLTACMGSADAMIFSAAAVLTGWLAVTAGIS